MKIIDIINKLNTQSKELFHKAFNIWCNFIYEKDVVYTEELVTFFMVDTIYDNIDSKVYVIKGFENYGIIDDKNWSLIYYLSERNSYFITSYYKDILNNFIKEYGTDRIN